MIPLVLDKLVKVYGVCFTLRVDRKTVLNPGKQF